MIVAASPTVVQLSEQPRAAWSKASTVARCGPVRPRCHLGHIGPGCVHIVLPNRPEVRQQHGYIHSGAISANADSAGGYAAFTLLPEGTAVLTVEYKINPLAPAVGDQLEAVGIILKSGRTLTICRLEVFAGQSPQRLNVAAGQQTLMCVRERPEL